METVIHKADSIINLKTIHKSKDKIPKEFLKGAGTPDDIIRWQHSLHRRPTVFISYDPEDEKEKDHLLKHLRILQSNDKIEVWHDKDIRGGADWSAEIKKAIARASIVILLISPNFLASHFIRKQEIPGFLRRQQSKQQLHIYPIIARPCSWQIVPELADIQVRPFGGKPIWGKDTDPDEELAKIAAEVNEIILDLMFQIEG